MPWPKGQSKERKTGGRKKGTPNKRTLLFEEKLTELDFDPLSELQALLPELSPPQRAKALLALLEYLYPKRKANEAPESEEALSLHEQIIREIERDNPESNSI